MAVYVAESRKIRAMMEALTPAIEPLSLDEAFMDLSGTARLHGAPPAHVLARFAKRVEDGTASSEQARASGAGARPMAELAWRFAQQH